MKTPDFEEVVRQSENYNKFLGELWDVSGLSLSWGPDAVIDFLACWKVSSVKTFRQGYRRTWVVRAMEQPISTKLQHEFGLAVISSVLSREKRYKIKRSQNGVSFRAEETWKGFSFPTDLDSSGRSASTTKSSRRQGAEEVNRGTSQPSKTVNLNTTPTAMDLGEIGQTPARATVIPTIERDLGELIARAVAAAMTPLDAQLKMLQTEIIAMKSLEGINDSDGMGDI